MNNVKSHFIFLAAGLSSILFFLPIKASAFCPLCMVATGTITGILRYLGVDDAIVGLWLGAFTLSSVLMLNKFLIKRGKKIKFQLPLIFIGSYALLLSTLYWADLLNPYNKILGINKIIFGMIIGSLLILAGHNIDRFLRKQNQDKIFISHQKMIVAMGLLIIFSFIFYFIIQ